MRIALGFLLWIIAVPYVCFYGAFCSLIGFSFPHRKWVFFFNRLFCHSILLLCGIRVRLEGVGNIDRRRTYVLCANHQGMFDILVINGRIPLPMAWISKPSYFEIPFVGWGMRASKHVLVTRTDKERDRAAIDQAIGRLRQGITMSVFPEGRRSRDGRIGPFKFGAFKMSLESGCPILPVVIQGSRERIAPGEWLVKPGVIRMKILPPLELSGETVESLHAKTEALITSAFNQGL